MFSGRKDQGLHYKQFGQAVLYGSSSCVSEKAGFVGKQRWVEKDGLAAGHDVGNGLDHLQLGSPRSKPVDPYRSASMRCPPRQILVVVGQHVAGLRLRRPRSSPPSAVRATTGTGFPWRRPQPTRLAAAVGVHADAISRNDFLRHLEALLADLLDPAGASFVALDLFHQAAVELRPVRVHKPAQGVAGSASANRTDPSGPR